jgi:hypothetical protein
VHVISVEKNYVKESINVDIENIDKAAQDEYYLPFTADQVSRLGAVEVKNRKDTSAGPLDVKVTEFDPKRFVPGIFSLIDGHTSNAKRQRCSIPPNQTSQATQIGRAYHTRNYLLPSRSLQAPPRRH